MKKILFGALLALLPLLSPAESFIYSNSSVAIIMESDVPCANKTVLQAIKVSGEPWSNWEWGQARVLYQGNTIDACFSATTNGVYIVDENGAGGIIPLEEVRKLKET